VNRLVRHALERLKTVKGFEKVRFIILYGSVAEERARAGSDIDLCISTFAGHEREGSLRKGGGESRRPFNPAKIELFLVT